VDDQLEVIKKRIQEWKTLKALSSPEVYWLIDEVGRLRKVIEDLEQQIWDLTNDKDT
jgi:hypothetical protein